MFEKYYSNKNNYGFSNILTNNFNNNQKNNFNNQNNFFGKNSAENQKVFQNYENKNFPKKNKKNSNNNINNNNTIKQSSYDILNNNPFNKNAQNFHKKKDGISDLLNYSNKNYFNNYNSKENFSDELYGKNNPYQNSIRSSYPYYSVNKKKTPNKKINNINNKDFFASLPLPNYNNNNNNYNNYNYNNNYQKNFNNQNFYNKNNIINNNNNNFPKNNLYTLNQSNSPQTQNLFENFTEIESENVPEYFSSNCTIIKEYAYKEDQNSKYRNYMEDKGKCINNFNNSNNILFCLFDGHGGHEVSTYLQKNFPQELKSKLQTVPKNSDLTNTFIELCKEIDEKIKNENYNNIGSTACIIYITEENNKRVLYCVNLGDTRCVLLKENDYVRLSYDDRASDEEENRRIVSEGGMVFSGRVFGILMLSRAFGDWELKDYGVSNLAHVYKMEITGECKNLVIASDGIWDVVNEADLVEIRNNSADSKEFCDKILSLCVERGSMDNLSCFVVKLN